MHKELIVQVEHIAQLTDNFDHFATCRRRNANENVAFDFEMIQAKKCNEN